MIWYIKGIAQDLVGNIVVVECGGVGYGVCTPNAHSISIDDAVELYIHSHWGSEQGPSLYGFSSKEERAIFQLMIGCPGVGPKIAVSALSQIDAGSFLAAIRSGDSKVLSSLSGIGKKRAEQIIVQLRDRISKLELPESAGGGGVASDLSKVSEVLESLGYSRTEISGAADYLRRDHASGSFDELLRKALSFLSKKV